MFVRIRDIADINSKVSITGKEDAEKVVFIPMAAVSDQLKSIVHEKMRCLGDVKKGYTSFRKGDVLLAKITPCFENGKIAIADISTEIGFGTTEFHVFSCNESKLYPRYLYYILSSPHFRHAGKLNMTGSAGQKRVPVQFIKNLKIPLPPLPIQKKIAEVLDKADELRQIKKKTIEKLDQLIQSIFLDMFGDPVTNPKGWEVKKFNEVGKLERGKSKHRPRNAPELLGGIYPLIQTGDVANSGGYITEFKQTYSEIGLQQSRIWPKGTLCITIAANIANTGILTFDACFPDSVVGFTPNRYSNTEYIRIWISFLQKILEDKAPESAQKNINLKILSELDVPTPPICLQQDFENRISKVSALKIAEQGNLQKQNNLFNSLMQKAFKGELKFKD